MNYILSKRKPEIGDRGFIIGNRFIPIQKVNNMPSKGLVFYIPLNEYTEVAKTRQKLTYYGNLSFYNVDGIDCIRFTGNSSDYLEFSDATFPKGTDERSSSRGQLRTAECRSRRHQHHRKSNQRD